MQELWLLRSALRLMLINIYMKFREDSLNGYRADMSVTDRQTDRQMPRGQTICLPTLKGEGDIISTYNLCFLWRNYKKL